MIAELPVTPWWKDYDDCREDRPTMLAARFDMAKWLVVSAFEGERRLGGTIVAYDTPGCDMLDGRSDLVVPFDVRVDPDARGTGVGRTLFAYVAEWARSRGCVELHVETQDVNVGACRFYRAMGCDLYLVEEGAYGPKVNEVKLIWRLTLVRGGHAT